MFLTSPSHAVRLAAIHGRFSNRYANNRETSRLRARSNYPNKSFVSDGADSFCRELTALDYRTVKKNCARD
jgi:hypothetical protein